MADLISDKYRWERTLFSNFTYGRLGFALKKRREKTSYNLDKKLKYRMNTCKHENVILINYRARRTFAEKSTRVFGLPTMAASFRSLLTNSHIAT